MLVDLFFLSKLFSLSFCIYFLALHCQLFSMKIIIVLANIFIIYGSCAGGGGWSVVGQELGWE